ncbi:hypothetical protein [Brevibacillus brevis]|uniref:hypothetical protein n=1 Tax=Brevibacillus brevis TaxID=1393 RepID=UPI0007D89B7A|nr:hypothetical protein [Brevibacillus brevis]
MKLLKQIFKPKLPRTTLNRESEKYYSEMQKLARDLVSYLSMNEDPNEETFQGNWNLTFLEENMTEEEYEKIVFQMMCRIPLGRLIEIINKSKYIKAEIVR